MNSLSEKHPGVICSFPKIEKCTKEDKAEIAAKIKEASLDNSNHRIIFFDYDSSEKRFSFEEHQIVNLSLTKDVVSNKTTIEAVKALFGSANRQYRSGYITIVDFVFRRALTNCVNVGFYNTFHPKFPERAVFCGSFKALNFEDGFIQKIFEQLNKFVPLLID